MIIDLFKFIFYIKYISIFKTPSAQTNKIDVQKHPEFITAGGGFGPVADDGYGVSYIFNGENFIAFHISSKKSCDKTVIFYIMM